MKAYLDYLRDVFENGVHKDDRTGTGTRSVFGRQMRFDLNAGFPLVTSKKLHLKSIIHELLWFIKGATNTKYLTDNSVTIWDEWAEPAEITVDKTIADLNAELGALCTPPRRVWMPPFQRADGSEWMDGDPPREKIKYNRSSEIKLLVKEEAEARGLTMTKVIPNPKAGDLGPIYGYQWRSWPTHVSEGDPIDQLKEVIDTLRKNPDSRRIIVSAWNVADIPKMKLPPCHAFFQFYSAPMMPNEFRVEAKRALFNAKLAGDVPPELEAAPEQLAHMLLDNDARLDAYIADLATKFSIPTRRLSCQLYQRSADSFLGVPFNIASYALLTMMVAQQTNHALGDFVWVGGDCHIYSNHYEQVEEQLRRDPMPLPTMRINKRDSIDDYVYEDFTLVGYESHPAIKAPVAV